MQRFATLVEALSRLAGYVAVGLIVVAVAIVCEMLSVRFFFGMAAIWQSEFVTFSLVAATFLGAPYVLLTGGHVNVDLVPHYLPPRARRMLALLAGLIGLAFCAMVFWTSLPWWWEAWSKGFTTSTMWRARLFIPYASVPVGMGLLVLQYVVEIWSVAVGRRPPFGITDGDGR
jgi:TRAP-type C4-dicarboxylate transport system permease small subunit